MLRIFLSTAIVLAVPASLSAEPAAVVAPAPAAADPFEQVLTARHVADFARRRHSAQSMIVAARMLQEVKFEDAPASPAAPSATPPDRPAAFTPDGLYAEAEAMAKDDPQVLAQIRIARSSGRGVLTSAFGKGLVRTVREVGPRAVYTFDVHAQAGALLRIGAIGDTNVSMAMRLKDGRGQLLCNDGGDYAPVCSIRPVLAAALRVEIENRSAAPTEAVILSN